jgi:hypothetical protein
MKVEKQILMFGAGDYVVDISTVSMKNTGDMPSMKLKKTGKTVTATTGSVFHVQQGKVANGLFFGNGMAMAMQLGMIPSGEGK